MLNLNFIDLKIVNYNRKGKRFRERSKLRNLATLKEYLVCKTIKTSLEIVQI